MQITFIYCIDYPSHDQRNGSLQATGGWLLCSERVLGIRTAGEHATACAMEYRIARPDVAAHFAGFPDNEACGFNIQMAQNATPFVSGYIELEADVSVGDGKQRVLPLRLDLTSQGIQLITIDDDAEAQNEAFANAEKAYVQALKQHPWLTIRMDITNKCNLKCIMCHYKEEQIYSRPAQAISAEALYEKIKDIAPYVKHIMLSCGFEPLMSKHFGAILSMLHTRFPHIETAYCTNAMLLNSKARKLTFENNVAQLILSLDGAEAATVERIRAGADFGRIVSHIKAVHQLKKQYGRTLPYLYINYVLMYSNIHEAPAFVEMCAALGIDTIDFRHLVGNIFFSEHEEMLTQHPALYNYYRPQILEAAHHFNMKVRLPDAFDTTEVYIPEPRPQVDLQSFYAIHPDEQPEALIMPDEKLITGGTDADFPFLAGATCLRPFNEIMITEDNRIMPCSYYSTPMGTLDGHESLHDIFFGKAFTEVRRRKFSGYYDHNCQHCPIRLNLLPTEVAG